MKDLQISNEHEILLHSQDNEVEKYKVVKIMRKSGRKEVIKRNLSRDAAKRLVNTYPDSNRSMVVFYKM